MFSPDSAVSGYEIWISAPGGVREVFDLGRPCGSQQEALTLAGAIADWLHLGVWFDSSLDDLPPDAQDDLFAMRRGYRADGVLGLVRVGAKPVARTLYDRSDDDEDEDDTAIHDRNDTPSYSVVPDDDYDLI